MRIIQKLRTYSIPSINGYFKRRTPPINGQFSIHRPNPGENLTENSLKNGLFYTEWPFELFLSLFSGYRDEILSAGTIAEKAMWRSVFFTIWHRILNADSTKTPSSSVTF